MDKIGVVENAGFNRVVLLNSKENPEDIFGILPRSRADQYDTYETQRLVDHSEFEEYKAGYETIITCYARIDGYC